MVDYKQKVIENTLKGVSRSGNVIKNPQHLKTIKDYFQIREEVDRVTVNTLSSDLQALMRLSQFLKDTSFSDATIKDIRSWMQWLRNEVGISDESAGLYGCRIKRFYKYIADPKHFELGKQEQKNIVYPDCVKWISTNIYDKNEVPLETLLTDDQILDMLNTSNIREQALIVTLLDGGLRIGEAMSLKVKSVKFDPKLGTYYILPKKRRKSVNGSQKTGSRTIQTFLIPSTTVVMKQYLNQYHKFRTDPDAPLFYSEKNGKVGEPLGERGAYNLITNTAKRAGIKTKLSPHDLRHNSATRAAKAGFNEMELRIRYGWSRSSTMPSKYVHLAGSDLSDKIYKIKGLKKDEIIRSEKLSPWICKNCQHENIPSNIVCGRCGMKLNITKEDIGVDATTIGLIAQDMSKDPEFGEFYSEMLNKERERLLKEFQNYKLKKTQGGK